MTLSRCSRLVAAAVLLCATMAVGASDEAGAWSDGVCTTADGVTVVVDFRELGGGVHVRCAPQPIASGFDALRQAGIDYRTALRQPGFLCRIAGQPESDPCVTTSPATAYWSYWLSSRSGQWCFSNLGAGNRVPPPGSVEGWSFALNRSATTAQPPRLDVPVALPGTQPAQLSPSDCVGGIPATATTTPPPGSGQGSPAPSTTRPESSRTAPSASAGGADAGSSPGSTHLPPYDPPPDETPAADAPTPSGDDSASDGGPVATAIEPPETPTSAGHPEDSSGGAAGSSGDEHAGDLVDLSGDGGGGGSPLGVVAAVVLVAALGGATAHLRRRQNTNAQG